MALKFDGLDFVKDGRKAYSESLNLFKKEVEDLNQHIMSGRDTGAQSTIDDLIAQHEREVGTHALNCALLLGAKCFRAIIVLFVCFLIGGCFTFILCLPVFT